jgi:VanZ family protein
VVNHDKFSHLAVFFLLAFVLQFSFVKIKWYFQILMLVGFAVLIELLQLTFFDRGFSYMDIAYGVAGAVLFFIMLIPINSLKLNQK